MIVNLKRSKTDNLIQWISKNIRTLACQIQPFTLLIFQNSPLVLNQINGIPYPLILERKENLVTYSLSKKVTLPTLFKLVPLRI